MVVARGAVPEVAAEPDGVVAPGGVVAPEVLVAPEVVVAGDLEAEPSPAGWAISVCGLACKVLLGAAAAGAAPVVPARFAESPHGSADVASSTDTAPWAEASRIQACETTARLRTRIPSDLEELDLYFMLMTTA